jgi:hypothetical protein
MVAAFVKHSLMYREVFGIVLRPLRAYPENTPVGLFTDRFGWVILFAKSLCRRDVSRSGTVMNFIPFYPGN